MINTTTLEAPTSNAPPDFKSGRLKRVLFVLRLDPAGKFGSIEEQALTLARAFRERGSLFLPVFLKPLDAESANQYARERLEFEALDFVQFRPGILRTVLALVGRHQIDVVHWNFYHPLSNGYLWALTILRPSIEHYYTDHISRPGTSSAFGGRRRLKTKIKSVLLSRYRKILCVSDYVLAQERDTAGPRAQRIHHFINTDRFRPDPDARREVRMALGVREEFVAVTVAHLIKDKGIDVALNALAQLPEQVQLWVVGEGPERGRLEKLVQELGMGHRVRLLGPRRNVEQILKAADCALCPSVWAEAAGLVNLEALACGLPVIASRIGGIPELVEDGRTGFLFTAGDSQELAQRIRVLKDDEPRRLRMGKDARADAVARFSPQSQIGRYLALYAARTYY
jgi:glycosyltransferase involved in cell wall biosynthesis